MEHGTQFKDDVYKHKEHFKGNFNKMYNKYKYFYAPYRADDNIEYD